MTDAFFYWVMLATGVLQCFLWPFVKPGIFSTTQRAGMMTMAIGLAASAAMHLAAWPRSPLTLAAALATFAGSVIAMYGFFIHRKANA